MKTLWRIGAIAIGSSICAVLSGLAALQARLLFLPSSDTANGLSLLEVIRDPFAVLIFSTLTAGAGVIGFGLALWLLRGMRLEKVGPGVFLASSLAAAVTGAILTPLSPVMALFAAAGFMSWSRQQADWKIPDVDSKIAEKGAA
jgi:hypothetical protein